jgi:hypothetical protein
MTTQPPQPLTNDDMSESESDGEDDQILNKLHESVTQGEIDLDETMVSAAHAGKSKGGSGSSSFV